MAPPPPAQRRRIRQRPASVRRSPAPACAEAPAIADAIEEAIKPRPRLRRGALPVDVPEFGDTAPAPPAQRRRIDGSRSSWPGSPGPACAEAPRSGWPRAMSVAARPRLRRGAKNKPPHLFATSRPPPPAQRRLDSEEDDDEQDAPAPACAEAPQPRVRRRSPRRARPRLRRGAPSSLVPESVTQAPAPPAQRRPAPGRIAGAAMAPGPACAEAPAWCWRRAHSNQPRPRLRRGAHYITILARNVEAPAPPAQRRPRLSPSSRNTPTPGPACAEVPRMRRSAASHTPIRPRLRRGAPATAGAPGRLQNPAPPAQRRPVKPSARIRYPSPGPACAEAPRATASVAMSPAARPRLRRGAPR